MRTLRESDLDTELDTELPMGDGGDLSSATENDQNE